MPVPARPPARPPERVAAGPLLLRRVAADDAGPIAAAVGASLEHLRPWMPWATPEAADLRTQLVRVAEADELWESGTGFIYVMLARGCDQAGPAPGGSGGDPEFAGTDGGFAGTDGEFVGTIGLYRRAADDAVEIGYWIASAKTRRGYATAAARALTPVALALSGARRVEIHCDEANTASAAIPRKLGYRLDRVEAHEREAPGERGRRMIWVWDQASGPPELRWSAGPTGRAARAGAG
jgi:RimJ/RimL family protein N-acetyltransferase